jgi:DNA-binding PadR family transcriptional regulator
MPPVFAHGRLRLYLLRLLDEAPRHGYEVIRLLEERFQGLYAPSAGTVYPRLAKLEAEGLVTHSTEGGRKIYSITEAGRAELAERQAELAELELEIRESLASLAADIREDVSGSARDLRREVREQAQSARGARGAPGAPGGGADADAWRQAREDMKRAKQEWKAQAKRAQDDARKARRQAHKEREAHAEAMQEMRRIARQVQDQVREQAKAGDWQGAVQSGLSELGRNIGDLGRITGHTTAWPPYVRPEPAEHCGEAAAGAEAEDVPDWAADAPSEDPARDLERLLDQFRDDVRDSARDHGVTEDQLRDARRHLASAAAHIAALLRRPHAD